MKRKDPVTAFHFGFRITRGPLDADYTGGTAWFKAISGLSVNTDAQDVTEGGVSSFTRKVMGMTKWQNIVMKNGFTGSRKFFHFCKHPRRIDGLIIQLGHKLKPVCRWEFYNGYPVKWTGPDYDATKNELAIETIEFVHEGLVMNPSPPQEEEEFEVGLQVDVDVDVDVGLPGGASVDVSAEVDVDEEI